MYFMCIIVLNRKFDIFCVFSLRGTSSMVRSESMYKNEVLVRRVKMCKYIRNRKDIKYRFIIVDYI